MVVVGIVSWDDERDIDRYAYEADDDGCRCRFYTESGCGLGEVLTDTDGCPLHDEDMIAEFERGLVEADYLWGCARDEGEL